MSRANGMIMMERRDEDMTLFFFLFLLLVQRVSTQSVQGAIAESGGVSWGQSGDQGRKDLLGGVFSTVLFYSSFLLVWVRPLWPAFFCFPMAFVCLAFTYHLLSLAPFW
jgi:hypothetical protein